MLAIFDVLRNAQVQGASSSRERAGGGGGGGREKNGMRQMNIEDVRQRYNV